VANTPQASLENPVRGYLAVVLHAHLPYVRHPEHPRFLEENWLFEAITETYIPLLQVLKGWQQAGMRAQLTLTLTPTLCAMLQDSLLQDRYARHLGELIDLADREVQRTLWEKPFHELALFYHERLVATRGFWLACGGDLVSEFRRLQDAGQIEIITCAATHALLPFLEPHAPSLRAQIFTARDHYRSCFGRDPRGIWLPECAYAHGLDDVLRAANLRWFLTDTHGLLHARPRPRYGMFAPVLTPAGLAAFGRDLASAKQVWSRHEGYPGDPRYRDFYRDIGFDLDLDYLKPYLAASDRRGFTGLKYYRITGPGAAKAVYQRSAALQAADQHANHFLASRLAHLQELGRVLDRPPIVLSPYDAELFGHWWYEGPEFLDLFVRKAYFDQHSFSLVSPESFLQSHPTHQVALPAASSWGEEGYWRVWLNEKNEWIYPHLRVAQERMTELVRCFPKPDPLTQRALQQAGRELLLAQASDWPFILRTGTSPEYARRRVKSHLNRFTQLYEQLKQNGLNALALARIESLDNLFPDLNPQYWA
jgi:1,4-alpha-glucan branching enzyme